MGGLHSAFKDNLAPRFFSHAKRGFTPPRTARSHRGGRRERSCTREGRGEIRGTGRRARPGEAPVGRVERPVMLLVQDDGPGIPESVRERLFEPFVTGRTGGSGLGLAIVQRAVDAHRGVILVDTVAGSGTTFSIFLPATSTGEEGA